MRSVQRSLRVIPSLRTRFCVLFFLCNVADKFRRYYAGALRNVKPGSAGFCLQQVFVSVQADEEATDVLTACNSTSCSLNGSVKAWGQAAQETADVRAASGRKVPATNRFQIEGTNGMPRAPAVAPAADINPPRSTIDQVRLDGVCTGLFVQCS